MKYPIGIQSFEQIINEGYVYVDKTDLVYQLTQGKVYFLSRPRRFGKSLLISTLENYYLGKRELFKGLKIDSLEQEWKTYPVFHIDFNGDNYTDADTPEYVYIFEFKLDGSAKVALQQINDRGYATEYMSLGKKISKVGVNISSKTGTVAGWETEEL